MLISNRIAICLALLFCSSCMERKGDEENQGSDTASASTSSANSKLLAFYTNQDNFTKVRKNVEGFFGPSITNACVAYASTALRLSGTPIPLNLKINGDGVSFVTLAFSDYLQKTLHWKKITKAADLRPGDIVLTGDTPKHPKYPSHTYMFVSWFKQKEGIGNVVDNFGPVHQRHVFGLSSGEFQPFSYALRDPK